MFYRLVFFIPSILATLSSPWRKLTGTYQPIYGFRYGYMYVDSDVSELKHIQSILQSARETHGQNAQYVDYVYAHVPVQLDNKINHDHIERVVPYSKEQVKRIKKMEEKLEECLKSERMTVKAYKIVSEKMYEETVAGGKVTRRYLEMTNRALGNRVDLVYRYPDTELDVAESELPELDEMNELLMMSPRGKQLEVDDFSMLHQAKRMTKDLYRQFKKNHDNALRLKQVVPVWHDHYQTISGILKQTPLICSQLQDDYTFLVNALTYERSLTLKMGRRVSDILGNYKANRKHELVHEQVSEIETINASLPEQITLIPGEDVRKASERFGFAPLPIDRVEATRPIGRETMYFRSPRGKEEGQRGALYWHLKDASRAKDRFKAMEFEAVIARCVQIMEAAERLLVQIPATSKLYEHVYFVNDDAFFLREQLVEYRKAMKTALIDGIDTRTSKKAFKYKINYQSLERHEELIRHLLQQ